MDTFVSFIFYFLFLRKCYYIKITKKNIFISYKKNVKPCKEEEEEESNSVIIININGKHEGEGEK